MPIIQQHDLWLNLNLPKILACGATAKPSGNLLGNEVLFWLIFGLLDLVSARGSPCDMSQGLPPAARIISKYPTRKCLWLTIAIENYIVPSDIHYNAFIMLH